MWRKREAGWSQGGACCAAAGGGREELGEMGGREETQGLVTPDFSAIVHHVPADHCR